MILYYIVLSTNDIETVKTSCNEQEQKVLAQLKDVCNKI
jgi:hypothetical protein